jgi:hypothetical protein
MIFFLSFAAAINAATLALIDAGVAMKDFLVACSALYIDRVPLLGASWYHFRTLFALTPDLCFYLCVRSCPCSTRNQKVTMTTMDARLPLEAFEVSYKGKRIAPRRDDVLRLCHFICTAFCFIPVTLLFFRLHLQSVVSLGVHGCGHIHEILRSVTIEHTSKRLDARGIIKSDVTSN